MDWGAPILDSSVSSIDVDGPNYRGVPALWLAERDTPFESVAALLWTGSLPTAAPVFGAPTLGADPSAVEALVPPGAPIGSALGVVVAALGAADGLAHGQPLHAELAAAGGLIFRLAAWCALVLGERATWRERAERALAAPSVAGALTAAIGARPEAARPIDRALVLCAEHELNVSTFAARVAASSGSDRYAIVAAALAAWSGPRHGGASERVEILLRGPEPQPRARLAEVLRATGEVPGFGHRLYPSGDPRAEALFADARAAAPDSPRWTALERLVEEIRALGHPPPSLDVGLVALSIALDLPEGAPAAMFAVGRVAGWLAHGFEQRETRILLRPRARYTGL